MSYISRCGRLPVRVVGFHVVSQIFPAMIPVEASHGCDALPNVATLVLVVTSFFHREQRAIGGDVPVVLVHVVTVMPDEERSIWSFFTEQCHWNLLVVVM